MVYKGKVEGSSKRVIQMEGRGIFERVHIKGRGGVFKRVHTNGR